MLGPKVVIRMFGNAQLWLNEPRPSAAQGLCVKYCSFLFSPCDLAGAGSEQNGGLKTHFPKLALLLITHFCLSDMAMSSSLLWAVDIFGRVYTLSTVGQYWELCKDTQLEFKRVSAVKQCCWGIACDHQVYTYVFSGDVPIRYQEETYENQVCSIMGTSAMYSSEWNNSTSLHQLSLHVILMV